MLSLTQIFHCPIFSNQCIKC